MSTLYDDLKEVKGSLGRLVTVAERTKDSPVAVVRAERLTPLIEKLDDIIERFGDPDRLFEPKPDYIDSTGKKTVSLADLDRNELEMTLLAGASMDELAQEAERWSTEYPKQLEFATDTWRKASYLLYRHLGFRPSGKAKNWLSTIARLVELADGDIGTLEQAVVAAAKARQADNLTFGSVMSIQHFVTSASSQAEVRNRPQTVQAAESGRVSL